MARALSSLLLALVAASAAAGCSWTFVRPAPRPPSAAPLTCTTARDAPIADASLTGLLIASGATLASCPGLGCRTPLAWTALAATLVLVVPAAISTRYGFVETARCREAQAAAERAAAERATAPPPATAPPAGPAGPAGTALTPLVH